MRVRVYRAIGPMLAGLCLAGAVVAPQAVADTEADADSTTAIDYSRTGVIEPVLSASFQFEQAAEAHDFIQERRNTGKVILIP